MKRKFTLDRVIKSAAGLDPDKMLSFQSHWMSQLPAEGKTHRLSADVEAGED